MKFVFRTILALFLFILESQAFEGQPIAGSCIQYFTSDENYLLSKLSELQWKPLPDQGANFGYSSKSYWFKLDRNCLPEDLGRWSLEIAYPLESIFVLTRNNENHPLQLKVGEIHRQSENLPKYRNHLIPLSQVGKEDLYFKVVSGTSIQLPLYLQSIESLAEDVSMSHLLLGIFFGVVLFGFVYNFFNYIWFKNLASLYYSGFLLFYGSAQLGINRILQTYAFENWYWLNLNTVPLLTGPGFGFFFLFSRTLLETKEHSLWIDRILLSCSAVLFLLSFGPFFFSYRTSVVLALVASTLFICISILTAIFSLKLSHTEAAKRICRLYLVAWTPFQLSFVVLVAKALGFLPNSWITNYGPQFGILFGILAFNIVIRDRFENIRSENIAKEKQKLMIDEEQKRLAAIGAIASEVSHDIQSPLAAIRSVENELYCLPEDTRLLLRNGINRIGDIANLLAAGSHRSNKDESNINLISHLIEILLSEKRAQYRCRMDLKIQFAFNPSAYGIFVEVDSIEFKRILSNLINNSAEAIQGPGQITVSLRSDGDQALIQIRDTGIGISDFVLAELGDRPISEGKEFGQGLGLFHASRTIKDLGGSLVGRRLEKGGTEISIRLTKCDPPSWFIPRISIRPGDLIVSLDDDSTIHQVWESRVRPYCKELIHFTQGKEFESFAAKDPRFQQVKVFLIDFELLGDQHSGLELIKRASIESKSILVTSKFDDPQVRKACDEMEVKLLPKSLAGFIPIDHVLGTQIYALVDDEIITHQIWKLRARKLGLKLCTFFSSDELMESIENLPKSTIFYIDHELKDRQNGGELAKRLFDQGFSELHITTGHKRSDLMLGPWVRSIQNKQPPWN